MMHNEQPSQIKKRPPKPTPTRPKLVGTGVQKGLRKTPVYDAEYIEHSSGPWKYNPKPRYVDARPFGWLGIVAIVALFVAALVIVGRAW